MNKANDRCKSRASTHADDCWSWGLKHYECAVGKVDRMRAENERLRAENERLRAERDALAAAIAAAVNFIREHGHTLLEAMRDAERLDYIERTYSGVTSQERYLPVKMVWGKGCNGRTLREACDKYMARDAAKESTNG